MTLTISENTSGVLKITNEEKEIAEIVRKNRLSSWLVRDMKALNENKENFTLATTTDLAYIEKFTIDENVYSEQLAKEVLDAFEGEQKQKGSPAVALMSSDKVMDFFIGSGYQKSGYFEDLGHYLLVKNLV